MGFRFRKTVSLLPGVRLNVSKQGPSSISIGGRGFTYNIGKKGTRTTGGLPGSGLSYSHYEAYGQASPAARQEYINPETGEITTAPQKTWLASIAPWLKIVAIALVAFAIDYLRK